MPRPLTRAQALENRAFLKELRRTGNVRLACRELGLKYGTMQHRRRANAAFAARWDAALAFAQTSLGKRRKSGKRRALSPTPLPQGGEGLRSGSTAPSPRSRRGASRPSPGKPGEERSGFRTAGGEAVLVRLKNGTLQMRRAQPGKLTREAEQAFLSALSATCNMTLAAAAVGCSPHAFFRRRKQDPAFDREVRLALQRGYDALELALIESFLPRDHAHDEWRHNDPPAIPEVSASQALQLMYLHQKEARLTAEPDHLKRRRGESREAHNARLVIMWEEQQRRSREEFVMAEIERMECGEPAWGPAGEDVRARVGAGGAPQHERHMGLPDLSQVTGWSRADPAKGGHDPERALFGGWRIEEMEERLKEGW